MSLTSSDSIPVFRFDDGWMWSRVPIDSDLWSEHARFRLFDASHRSMLSVTLVPPYRTQSREFAYGEGLLALESAEVYRRRVLPLWVSVLNVHSGLHLLKKDEQGLSRYVVAPVPVPDAWVSNAASLQPEFEALLSEFSSRDDQALFLGRLFSDSEVMGDSVSSFRVGCQVKYPSGLGKCFYVGFSHHGARGILFYSTKNEPVLFTSLSSFMRALMEDHFLVPASEQDAWVDAHSAPGRVLLDFEPFDLMGVPHPVVDVEERFVPWAEAYVASF